MVDEFVAKKEQWIKKKQSTLTHKPALIEENRIQLLGNSLRIRRICGSHPLVYYSEDTFYVQYEKKEQCDKLIQAYLDQLCDDIFHDIALLTCKRLKAYHISMPQIKLRMMKSQWGNCKPTLGQITPVSYTHLDVYKRQVKGRPFFDQIALAVSLMEMDPDAGMGIDGDPGIHLYMAAQRIAV